MVPLNLCCVWRGHLYLPVYAPMLAPPSFSMATITPLLDQKINIHWWETELEM